jgi:murein DD-endopeptidase MepM/ murein hydrolase activator NlpD
VDYAANSGTPIRAAGDGRVTFAGVKGGWGNVIIIQHGETYKTLYAHQSRFARGIRQGSRVRQGQVIGYVGMSGLASGPHLHYEFYVNGVVRNPVTVDLPEAEPIGADEFERFRLQTAGLLALLQEGATVEQQLAVTP